MRLKEGVEGGCGRRVHRCGPLIDAPLLSSNRHLPEDGGAIGGFCEEPPPPGSISETGWRQMHENYLYRNMYRGSAVECRGWLMGWGGIAYHARSFNESLLTFLVSAGGWMRV